MLSVHNSSTFQQAFQYALFQVGKVKTADGLEEDESLSRMKKTDKFVPVITIVVYYGEKPWDGAKSLHEMLNIPE